jgi:hypothetical protein
MKYLNHIHARNERRRWFPIPYRSCDWLFILGFVLLGWHDGDVEGTHLASKERKIQVDIRGMRKLAEDRREFIVFVLHVFSHL